MSTEAGETEDHLKPPGASRQVAFYQLLVAARKRWFIDALSEALSRLDQGAIKAEAAEYIPGDAQKILAAAGLRDEYVFPLPLVLREKPSLVGYYRLLLGASQKSFYNGSTGLGRFRAAEEQATLSAKTARLLPNFCRAMSISLAELVRQIPGITDRDVRELPLLTFGSQLQGASNTQVGKKAMQDVFLAVAEIVDHRITKREKDRLTVRNASGRTVVITLGRDPDLSVCEVVNEKTHNKVAIEVKGGTDVSNVHERSGAAEKSHTKAKGKGFRDFWTIISKKGIDVSRLKLESQTTTLWFDVAEVLARKGDDWDEFRSRLISEVGIPSSKSRRRK